MKNKKVLMIVANYFNPDNRVYRAANALAEKGYDVILLAKYKEGLQDKETLGYGFQLIRIKTRYFIKSTKQFNNYQKHIDFKRKAKQIAKELKPDAVHSHDYNTLFLGVYCRKRFGSKLIYDNHEYFQDLNYLHRYPLIIRKKIAAYERKCLKNYVDKMVVVSPGIKKAYEELFAGKIEVIRNIPDIKFDRKAETKVPSELIENLDKLKDKKLKLLLYLGTNTQRGRGLDFAFKVVSQMEEFGLVIFGAKSHEEIDYLNKKAKTYDITQKFHVFPSLKIEQLYELRDYFSYGLSLIEPIYFSYKHSLPNKLFEYLSMGLPILSTDIPDQRQYIEKYNIGIALSNKLEESLQTLKKLPEFSNIALPKNDKWENEKRKYIELYNNF